MLKRLSYIRILAVLLLFSQNFQLSLANELGEDCTAIDDCTNGAAGDLSECGPENKCICNEASVPDNENTTCLEIVNSIGTPCQINRQCTQGSLGDQSYCDLLSGQVCRCNLVTSIPNAAGTKCLPIRATIGSPCEIDEQCRRGTPGFNSLCKNEEDNSEEGTCQCDEYSVTAPEQHRCLLITDKIGEDCIANIQCTTKIGNYSECRLTKCQCIENEGLENSDGTKCLQLNVPIRQSCEIKEQCAAYPNSACSTSGRCDCIEKFVPSSRLDNCLEIVNELGEPCRESQQCSSGKPGALSACIEDECRCTANATSGIGSGSDNEHVCRANAMYVGDTCEITAQCTINLGHSFCQGSSCVCLPDAVISRDEKMCLLKAYLGDGCTEDNQCSHVGHSVCSLIGDKRICECDLGYKPKPSSTTECMRMANLIGEPCDIDSSQCDGLGGAECRGDNKVCLCDAEKEVVNRDQNKCLEIRENLEEPCDEHTQCRLDNSWCQINGEENVKQCVCQPNFVKDNNRCLKKAANYNDTCLEDSQCDHIGLTGEVHCLEGRCQCEPPMDFHNRVCVKPAKLNEKCEDINECHLGVNNLAICVGKPGTSPLEKWCQCVPNAVEGEDGFCYMPRTVGESCVNDVECKVGILGPVNCISGSCTCERGYRADTGGIRCSGGIRVFSGFGLVGMVIRILGVKMLS